MWECVIIYCDYNKSCVTTYVIIYCDYNYFKWLILLLSDSVWLFTVIPVNLSDYNSEVLCDSVISSETVWIFTRMLEPGLELVVE